MKDMFDRDINVGDLVAYATKSSTDAELSIAEVIAFAGGRKGGVRVKVLRSNTNAFKLGLHGVQKDPETGKERTVLLREPMTAYEATVTKSDRIAIINGALFPKFDA